LIELVEKDYHQKWLLLLIVDWLLGTNMG